MRVDENHQPSMGIRLWWKWVSDNSFLLSDGLRPMNIPVETFGCGSDRPFAKITFPKQHSSEVPLQWWM